MRFTGRGTNLSLSLSLSLEMSSVALLNSSAIVLHSKPQLRPPPTPNERPRIQFKSLLQRSKFTPCCTSSKATGGHCSPEDSNAQDRSESNESFCTKWMNDTAEMRSRLAKLGLAAILAYGLFDGVTYTTFFVLAFLGYEKSTGKNPAANLQALLGIVVLMWTGNNITRPFRVAGAAALAPAIDKGLKEIQKYFNLPSLAYAFALVVSIVATLCLTVVVLLILSRWGK